MASWGGLLFRDTYSSLYAFTVKTSLDGPKISLDGPRMLCPVTPRGHRRLNGLKQMG